MTATRAPSHAQQPPGSTVRPSEQEAFWFWLKLGCISFGGPAGQIAIMHDELVERRRWISERRFLHALNFCMALPGPEAQQLASYVGYSLYGDGWANAEALPVVDGADERPWAQELPNPAISPIAPAETATETIDTRMTTTLLEARAAIAGEGYPSPPLAREPSP
jgi:hypothetical protein